MRRTRPTCANTLPEALIAPAEERHASRSTCKPTMRLDVDEGIRLGVTVTPAFFINGQLIVGFS
jgi:protein-disulfide isomerase